MDKELSRALKGAALGVTKKHCTDEASGYSFTSPYPFQVYKRKTEAAKKEYLKALAAYRANQECQVRGISPF